MGLVDWLISPRATSALNDNDFWYTPIGELAGTESGVAVGPHTALQSSAVWACVNLISQTIASLPCILYERIGETDRRRAVDKNLYWLLHDTPNDVQTPIEFFQMQVAHLLLRGNAYAFIVPGGQGFASQLIPLHPDNVTVEMRDGRIWYKVKASDGSWAEYTSDDISHIRGLSLDGVTGLSVIAYARETMALQVSMERYRARFFRNNATPAYAIIYDGEIAEDDRKRMLAQLNSEYQGTQRAHRAMLLDNAAKIEKIGLSAEDSQWLESMQFGVTEICRWFHVQPHKIFELSRATFSNIEHQAIEHVTDTLRPWCVRIEQALKRDLILPRDRRYYYVEFLLDALLRGDFKTRMEGYQVAILSGIMNPNEVRARENMNQRGDGLGDVYLRPSNVVPADTPATPPAAPAPPAEDDDAEDDDTDEDDTSTEEEPGDDSNA